MNKLFAISVLAVTAFFASQQDASARGFRISMGFYMEFGRANHSSWHAPHHPHYSAYPHYPAPIVIYEHASPSNSSNNSQDKNWTPPAPSQTPANGTTWSQPYQPYGNYYYPAYWYGR